MYPRMEFPKDWKDFIKKYTITGTDSIPIFRVEQMIAHYFLDKKTLDCMDSSISNLESAVPVDLSEIDEDPGI